MNFINPDVFKHHVESFNDFCDINSENCYTLKKLVNEAVKFFNEHENNKYKMEIKLNEPPVSKMPSYNRAGDITFRISGLFSYKNNCESFPLSASYPAVDDSTGLFSCRIDSRKNYYTPILRLLRRPSLKFIESAFDFDNAGDNEVSELSGKFLFKLIPEIGPHVILNFDIKNSELLWKLDETGLLAVKNASRILEYAGEASDAEREEKLFDEADSEFEDKLPVKYSKITLLTSEEKEEYKIISGRSQNIKFKLSAHLRKLLNRIFDIKKDENYQFIDNNDLAKIEDCFKKLLDNYKSNKVNDNSLPPFKPFEEYLRYHLPGMISEYDAVSVNEAFFSYTLELWKRKVNDFFNDFSTMTNKEESVIRGCIERIWEKSFRPGSRILMTSAFEFIDTTNPLAQAAHQRKYTFLAADSPRAYKTESAAFLPKVLRDNNVSTIGRFCPVETPESQKLGLAGHLTFDSAVSIKDNQVLANTSGGYVCNSDEETEFFKNFLKTTLNRILFGYDTNLLRPDYEAEFFKNKIFSPMGYEKSFIEWKKSYGCKFKLCSDESMFSYSTLMIPFIQNTDAARSLMGAKNMKSAVPLLNSEAPIIKSGFESKIFSRDAYFVKKSPISGKIHDIYQRGGNMCIIIGAPAGSNSEKKEFVEIPAFCMNAAHTFAGFIPCVFKGDMVNAGTTLAVSPVYNPEGEMAPLCGRNLLVAYSPFKGYNFEDGIVVSQRLVDEDILTSSHIIKFKKRYKKGGALKLDVLEKIISDIRSRHLYEEIAKEGPPAVLYYEPSSDKGKERREVTNEKKFSTDSGDEYFCDRYYGKVVNVELLELKNINNEDVYEINIIFLQQRPVEVGDKLMGRFGNKGVITKILPDNEMPKLKDGTSVDVILNPNGVISRMNLGQIFETQLSPLVKFGFFEGGDYDYRGNMIGKSFEKSGFIKEIISSAAGFKKIMKKVLKHEALTSRFEYAENFKVKLYKTGKEREPFFKNPVVAGYQYFFKLNHLSEDKVHARSEGSYDMTYQQPLKGKKFGGGQRLGEMEIWCLLALGADKTLNTALELYSQAKKRGKINSEIKNETLSGPAISHAMTAWFKALGLFIKMNGKGDEFNYSLALLGNQEQLKDMMKIDNDIICGENKPENFIKRIYNCRRSKKDAGNLKLIEIQNELVSDDYYNGFDYNKKGGNFLYHRFGFIKFNEPIINPLLADKLYSRLNSIIKSALPKDDAPLKKLKKVLNVDVYEYYSLKNDSEFRENYGCSERLKEIFMSYEKNIGNDKVREALDLVDKCSMEFLIVPPLILRMEDCIKNAFIKLKRLNTSAKNDGIFDNTEGVDQSEKMPILKFQNFLNRQYETIISMVNSGRKDIYNAVRTLFLSDDTNRRGILSLLATKEGLLRSRMLGRRIDFSGRAVIVPEPELKIGEVIISYKFAVKFLTKIMPGQGRRRELNNQIDYMNEWLKENKEYIIFNRQPSLHRFSMQAYRIAGICLENVIKLHPLACEGLGADFDGDTGALYYIGDNEIQDEIGKKIGIYNNLMQSFVSGKTLLHYEQDFQLGDHLLIGRGQAYFDKLVEIFESFSASDEVKFINAVIKSAFKNKYKTVGDFKKNADKSDLPKPVDVINAALLIMVKKVFDNDLKYDNVSLYDKTLDLVDSLKNISLKAATDAGVSFGIGDLIEISDKYGKYVQNIGGGEADSEEKFKEFIKSSELSHNGVALLINSGSRGNYEQIKQLIKTRGPMQVIRRDFPAMSSIGEVKNSLLEGHDIYEYFISAHGARCGLGQKKLLTPVCGHFTRMLVEGLYDFKISEKDCGTSKYLKIDLKEIESVIGVFESRNAKEYEKKKKDFIKYFLLYRYTDSGRLIVPELLKSEYHSSISVEECIELINGGRSINVRSPLKCESQNGLCSVCCGADITRGRLPEAGFRIGIITGQTIGERGTQLAMKMFHGGGIYKKSTFGNAVDELKKAFTEIRKDKKMSYNIDDAFYKLLKAVHENYIIGQKLSVMNFDILLKGMLGLDNKGKTLVKYSSINAGVRENRDFLARISYSGLATQTKNQIWTMIEKNIDRIEYRPQECSEKSRILFSAVL